ncbi:hypothetical protein AMI01nite_61020 [Aneurinibacillus migulanus]|nr:hypothetical protein AMI01nite_61020 [Aneurinibacillus migulanus]
MFLLYICFFVLEMELFFRVFIYYLQLGQVFLTRETKIARSFEVKVFMAHYWKRDIEMT